MIDLPYSLVIEATAEPDYFGFYAPELEGFTGWRLRVQSAITTSDSEPEPDFAIVPGPAERYLPHHPLPADIATLIEVADSSLARDREKKRIYGHAGIAIYWIINLPDALVEVYSEPTGADAAPGYRQRQDYKANDAVPLVIQGKEGGRIAVRDLLP